MDDESLCCCEYVDKNGERSHVLAALCDCEAIDEAFDRIITRNELSQSLKIDIMNTIEDRFRIPWPRGARKMSASYALPVLLNLIFIFLGSLNFSLSLLTYSLILPLTFYVTHRLFKCKRKLTYINNSQFCRKKLENNYKFYKIWIISADIYLLLIYYIFVLPLLKISCWENLVFLILLTLACASFYIVIDKANYTIKSSRFNLGDNIKSYESCVSCSPKVRESLSHCKICGACFKLRDHHCLWLNVCIGKTNERWFFAALLFSLFCLVYGLLLTMTTVCHPRIVHILMLEILIPFQCSNVYFDLSSSLIFSAGCYAIVLTVFVAFVLLKLICSVSARQPAVNTNRIFKLQNALFSFIHPFQYFLSKLTKFMKDLVSCQSSTISDFLLKHYIKTS